MKRERQLLQYVIDLSGQGNISAWKDLVIEIKKELEKPQQKPLSEEEIEKEHDKNGRDQSNVGFKSFIDGVRFAERMHGIS